MDLREKLKILEPEFGLRSQKTRRFEKPDMGKYLNGELLSNTYGTYFRAVSTFPEDHFHGDFCIKTIWEIDRDRFGLVGKDESLSGIDIRKTLFIDTETTGLAGGAGTVAFLIGLGYFCEDGFRIEQFFMRDYDEEHAVLEAVRERFATYDSLVSYNGKCYDMNLLSSRFIITRIENPAEDYPHLDLLFTVRRIWRRRIGDCSLSNIERVVLGFEREDDVPGFLIPGLYFDYLHTGEVKSLVPVFRHNTWDIVALAALTAKTGQIFSRPKEFLENPLDMISVGRAFESMLRYEEAADCYHEALSHALSSEENEEVLTALGFIYKRLGVWDMAVQVWDDMVKNHPYRLIPYEELAKYYEHRVSDFEKALYVVRKALERISLSEELRPDYRFESDRRDLEYRLARLRRKLERGM